jgi:ABC-type spermidine/putrescine transport system permease subunit II
MLSKLIPGKLTLSLSVGMVLAVVSEVVGVEGSLLWPLAGSGLRAWLRLMSAAIILLPDLLVRKNLVGLVYLFELIVRTPGGVGVVFLGQLLERPFYFRAVGLGCEAQDLIVVLLRVELGDCEGGAGESAEKEHGGRR